MQKVPEEDDHGDDPEFEGMLLQICSQHSAFPAIDIKLAQLSG